MTRESVHGVSSRFKIAPDDQEQGAFPVDGLIGDIRAFRQRKGEELAQARQMAALFCATGIDLAEALAASRAERGRLRIRLERMIERERLRGMRRHWSYDLNRHISLKQALDRLRRHDGDDAPPA
jgi:hypothetical protein